LLLSQVWKEKQYTFRAIAHSILLDKSLVDDVLQEAFTRILQSERRFSDEGETYNYIRKTVLNTTIDTYRRVRRQNSRYTATKLSTVSRTPGEGDCFGDPLTLLLKKEKRKIDADLAAEVRAALDKLSGEQKAAIQVFFGRDRNKKVKDICREQGVPYSTLRSRMLTGIEKIRHTLRQRGVEGFEAQNRREDYEMQRRQAD
jgi:RNA polymerase sigma factor (sigma-70 family)